MAIYENTVGQGQVVLLAGGGKVFTDTAARFCRSEKDLEDIIATPESKELIRAIVESRHYAALEFDYFIFGIQGYSRVTEVQLVRKRMASYLIKSGRVNKHGKRSYDVVIPESIKKVNAPLCLHDDHIYIETADGTKYPFNQCLSMYFDDLFKQGAKIKYSADYLDLLGFLETWYEQGVSDNVPEEDLRYMKLQATEFKALIGMNAHALRDWFMIRMCNRAQTEIRDLARKMHKLASEASPELFEGSGPSCVVYGYCPELEQCEQYRGKIPNKKEAMELLKMYHKSEE